MSLITPLTYQILPLQSEKKHFLYQSPQRLERENNIMQTIIIHRTGAPYCFLINDVSRRACAHTSTQHTPWIYMPLLFVMTEQLAHYNVKWVCVRLCHMWVMMPSKHKSKEAICKWVNLFFGCRHSEQWIRLSWVRLGNDGFDLEPSVRPGQWLHSLTIIVAINTADATDSIPSPSVIRGTTLFLVAFASEWTENLHLSANI